MDLEIRYEGGSMTVHLEEFLSCRSITKVRKLLKVIRSSFTPECEWQMKEFILNWLERFEQKQLENERYITGYEEKVKFCQRQLDNALYNRNQYKKSTPLHKSDGWEHYNEDVKQLRQELREIKALLHSWRHNFNNNTRNKEFYKIVLENII